MYKNVVIGSGLSAITTAAKLLDKNQLVYMYDIGDSYEEDINEFKNSLIKNKKNYFKILTQIIKNIRNKKNLNNKFYFGSEFSYKSKNEIFKSTAQGGLSNIWGANMLSYHPSDIAEWPISQQELQKNYDFLIKTLNIQSTKNNNLNKEFRFNSSKDSALRKYVRDKQTNFILKELNFNKKSLNKNNIFFGETNLSLVPNVDCLKCGFCFYGCPNNLIFNSKYLLKKLKKNKKFNYIPYSKVINFKEIKNKVILNLINVKNKKMFKDECDYLFLTNGTFNIIDLLKNSKVINQRINIYQSQQFIFFGKIRNFKEKISNQINTMAKINLDFKKKDISNNFIHIQIYPLSDILLFNSFYKINFLKKFFLKLFLIIFKKSFICIGYLPSNISSSLTIKKNIILRNKNHNEKKKINSVINHLNKSFSKTNLIFYKIFKIMGINSSFHVGASFPISKKREKNKSDLFGRVYNLKNTFILDSLILPKIYASTTTFTMLSNNLRIIDKIYDKQL